MEIRAAAVVVIATIVLTSVPEANNVLTTNPKATIDATVAATKATAMVRLPPP